MNMLAPLNRFAPKLKDAVKTRMKHLSVLIPHADSTVSENFQNEDNIVRACILLIKGYSKFIIAFTVSTSILVSGITLLMDNKYTATASILPPQRNKSTTPSMLVQGSLDLESLFGSFMNKHSTTELYAGILKSKSAMDEIINNFKLEEIYDKKYKSDLYRILDKRTKIVIDRKNQILKISVTDEDPQLASDITNAYIDILDKIYREISVSEGHRKRLFFKERIKKVSTDLRKAEIDLLTFQEKTGLISIEEQAKAFIEQATELKTELIASRINLEIQRQFGTERQNEALMLKAKIKEIEYQLNLIENYNRQSLAQDPNPASAKDIDKLSLQSIPALGSEYGGLLRNKLIQDKIFEMTTLHYELAKMEEAKDIRVIHALDTATAPDKKSSPNRSMIILLYSFSSIITSLLITLVIEHIKSKKHRDSFV